MIHRRTGVFWTSASSRYGIIAARDQCGWEGDARTTGHQKRSPAVKKHACSATCQVAESQLERRRHVPEPGRERHREHADERIPESLGRRGHEPAHARKPLISRDKLLTGRLPAATLPPERWMNGMPLGSRGPPVTNWQDRPFRFALRTSVRIGPIGVRRHAGPTARRHYHTRGPW